MGAVYPEQEPVVSFQQELAQEAEVWQQLLPLLAQGVLGEVLVLL